MKSPMQNIRSLEKSDLVKRTQDLVSLERKTTLELVEHLREIERRLLFLEYGYSSLFEFAVKHLGLSEGSAHRRISAMRLMRDVPEAKAKIESGEISLSNASQVQTAFRAAHLKPEQKRETLEKISGMTQKECQSALLELAPNVAAKLLERDRQISEEQYEIKLVVSKEIHGQIDELKAFLAHTLSDAGTSALLVYLVQKELKHQNKKRGLSAEGKNENGEKNANCERENTESDSATVQTKIVRSRKHISNRVRREIWVRAQGQCEASSSNGRCQSRYQLELDHIVPHAKGGVDSVENLRLICRAHNLQHAVESFGRRVMERYCP